MGRIITSGSILIDVAVLRKIADIRNEIADTCASPHYFQDAPSAAYDKIEGLQGQLDDILSDIEGWPWQVPD